MALLALAPLEAGEAAAEGAAVPETPPDDVNWPTLALPPLALPPLLGQALAEAALQRWALAEAALQAPLEPLRRARGP